MAQSKFYQRAQAIVLRDKLSYREAEMLAEITKLVGQYVDCQDVAIKFALGKTNEIVITVTASKVKPLRRV